MRSRHTRSVIGLVLACLGLALVWTPSVFAGGWAVTTLDPLPNELRAGETYAIGYVIRQHGQTPFTSAQTAIEIRSPDVRSMSSSRPGGCELTSVASRSRSSVVRPIALTTTTTS